jgi:hypothetical protein
MNGKKFFSFIILNVQIMKHNMDN